MSAQSKPPSGGEEIILDGDMDLDTLVAQLDAKKTGAVPPAPAVTRPPAMSRPPPAIVKPAAKPAAKPAEVPVAAPAAVMAPSAPPEPELVIPQAPEPAAPASDDLEMVNLDEEPPPAAAPAVTTPSVAVPAPAAAQAAAAPAAVDADAELSMVEADAPAEPAGTSGADSDLEMVDVGGADAADDDVEIVDVDAKPVPPPAAPLPDWLGDDVPAKPLVERPALAVDLSAPLPDAELDLRHEFQRETRPDPKYLFEETKALAKEDAGEVTYILCHKCGARNQIGVWVCRNCGDKLRISQEILDRYYQEQ